MAAIVKYPAKAANEPDCRFCGQCGRRAQPFNASGDGFGPCVEDAASVLDCHDFRRAIVLAYQVAASMGRDVLPETKALVERLGVPASAIQEWLEASRRINGIKEYLRRGTYGLADGAPWMRDLSDWVNDGDADEKILALVEDLKSYCDPTHGGSRSLSWIDITAWFERLGRRADEILSDPGDWETEVE